LSTTPRTKFLTDSAAMAKITAIAQAMKAAGQPGGMNLHRAQAMLGLLLGTLPPIPPAEGAPPDQPPGDDNPAGDRPTDDPSTGCRSGSDPSDDGPADSGPSGSGPSGSGPADSSPADSDPGDDGSHDGDGGPGADGAGADGGLADDVPASAAGDPAPDPDRQETGRRNRPGWSAGPP
jgi:hypothetical protein